MAPTLPLGSRPARDRRARGGRSPWMLLGLLCAGLPTVAAEGTAELFDRYEIATGVAKSQIVLSGRFQGEASAELAVVQLDAEDNGRVWIYGFDEEAWKPVVEASLRSEVLFVDVARIGARDRLLTYSPGSLSWLDPESGIERELLAIDFDYTEPPEGGLPYADITRDLNGDGRDELVLPSADGFVVIVQRGDGTFAAPVQMGPPEPHLEDSAIVDDYRYGEMGITPLTIPWYLGRIHVMDHDLDGRDDLAFWTGESFQIHRQDERGLFAPEPEAFSVDVAFDSDGEYSLQYGVKKTDSKQTALHSFRDLDRDGIPDLVTMSLEGPGMLGKRTTFEIHFGRRTPAGVAFSPRADTAVRSDGIRRGLRGHDFDHDGNVDLVFSNIKLGLFKLAGAFVANSFGWDLEVFRLENGVYASEPNAARRLKGSLRGKNAYAPPVLIGDVDGDGREDLIFGKNRKELLVFLGALGPGLLAERPHRLAVATPPDDESSIDIPYRRTRLVDLDRNGKMDLIIDRGSDREMRGVTVLIAR